MPCRPPPASWKESNRRLQGRRELVPEGDTKGTADLSSRPLSRGPLRLKLLGGLLRGRLLGCGLGSHGLLGCGLLRSGRLLRSRLLRRRLLRSRRLRSSLRSRLLRRRFLGRGLCSALRCHCHLSLLFVSAHYVGGCYAVEVTPQHLGCQDFFSASLGVAQSRREECRHRKRLGDAAEPSQTSCGCPAAGDSRERWRARKPRWNGGFRAVAVVGRRIARGGSRGAGREVERQELRWGRSLRRGARCPLLSRFRGSQSES